ncbi:undecaprenyl-phosphate glucose phosphotransferase [Paraburkholderia sp. BCC1885]|uniref:undecaprenyl-phosphate glucose phosphotransferase n=1 Tax=Paraburkholderia sp. BCC1885 TaxID=2562669 RepID=UPI001183CA13|nr:undecaprenyl-phosphate glucose phosphotransferase [Paraburkholderia sp. BCC1885]
MHTAIRQWGGRDSLELEKVLARLLDILLIASGAVAASFFPFVHVTHSIAEGAFVAFAVAFAVVLFPAFGVYGSWRGRSKIGLASRLSLAWILVQVSGLALMFALHRTTAVSRVWFSSWTVSTAVGLVVSRSVLYAALARLRRAGRNLRTVAVVGAGAHLEQVLGNVAASPASGFRAVGVFVTPGGIEPAQRDMRVYRRLDEFAAWVRAEHVAEVWLALSMSDEATVLRMLDEFGGDLVNLRFIPDVPSLAMFDGEMVDLIGAPAINLMASPLSVRARLQKAAFDRLFAAIALIALSPLLAAIAIAVKLSSKGPVLFTQRRKGADGKVFRIFKFRTMRAHVEEAGVIRQATRNDPRITRVGSFLRRTSLDELPQFLNVLRGEMSVVGPRPHAIEHDDHYQKIVDGYIHRYRIKPGITGWAQVNGFRGETDRVEKMQGRVEHDLYYLRNWSFGLDMRIVAATVMKGFTHRNAY